MTECFGDFVEGQSHNQEYLQIGFSPSSISLQERWRNNGLSADFLADYLATFFPGDTDEAQYRQAEIKDAVSYVANELLENAMKFSYALEQNPVSITMQLEKERVRFYVTNSVDPQTVPNFQAFIRHLLSADPDELYMEKLMENADEEGTEASGLGFLTMINNYNAKLAWQFDNGNGKTAPTVTTMVQLTV